MNNNKNLKPIDEYENELSEYFSADNAKIISSPDLKAVQAKMSQYAKNTLRKGKRVNIRIQEEDLQNIRKRAAKAGIPYQTIMASILHQYASGKVKVAI